MQHVSSVLFVSLVIVAFLFLFSWLLSSTNNSNARTVSVYLIDGEGEITENTLKGKPGTKIAIEDIKIPIQDGYRFSAWFYDAELKTKYTDLFIFLEKDFSIYAKMYKEHTIEYTSEVAGFINPDENKSSVIEKDSFKLQPASLDGFSFMYWEYNGEKISTIENITSDIIVNGVFTSIVTKTTLSFNIAVEGGSDEELLPIIKTPGSLINLPVPAKSNYQFDGWYTDVNLTNKYDGGNIQPLNDITLYAKFYVQYQVTFSTLASGIVTWNNSIETITTKDQVELNLPTLDNHNFLHFTVDGTILLENTLKNISKNITVVGVFTKINTEIEQVSVDFVVVGLVPQPTTLTGLPGSKLNLPTFEAETGKRFSGWYIDVTLTTKYVGGKTFPQNDLTLYGELVEEFKISYESAETGFIHTNKPNFINDELFHLEPAFKTGFEFNNWTIAGNVVTEIDGSLYSSDISVEAHFTKTVTAPTTTKIMFMDQNSLLSTIDVPFNTKPIDHLSYPSNPTVTGNTFKFWSLDKTIAYDVSTPIPTDQKDFILYSVYELNDVYLKFVDKDGLEIPGAPTTIKYGKQLNALPGAPNVVNHTFSYYWDSVNSQRIDLNTIFMIENDALTPIILTATYVKTKVDVVLKVDGVTFDTFNGEAGNVMNLTIPTKPNHQFIGWFTDEALAILYVGGKTFPQNDLTLYGKFVEEFKITYESAEAGFIHSNPLKILAGETIVLKVATLDNYLFKGWTIDDVITTSLIGSQEITTKVVTAVFEPVIKEVFKITYTTKSGGLNPNTITNYTEKTNQFSLNNPTHPGYLFNHWEINGSVVSDFIPLDHLTDVEIIAIYEMATSFSITYVDVDGNVLSTNNQYTYNYESQFVLDDGEKTGYTFIEWILDLKIITQIMSETYGDITITGRFKANIYKITYDVADGDFNPLNNPVQYSTSDETITLIPATSLGYKFLNFAIDGNILTANQFEPSDHLTNVTIKVIKGLPIVYNIYYVVDGISTHFKTYTIKDNVTLPTTVVKQGYTFIKWIDKSGQETTDVLVGTTGDLYFTGVFTLTKYSVAYYFDPTTVISTSYYSFGLGLKLDDRVAIPDAHKKFIGWYDNAALTDTPITHISETDDGDKKVYAKFDDILYNVTINANGGLVNGSTEVTIPLKFGTAFSSILPATLLISLPDSTKYPGTYSNGGFWMNDLQHLTLNEDVINQILYINWEGQFEYQMVAGSNYYSIVGFALATSSKLKVVIPPFRYQGIETLAVQGTIDSTSVTALGAFPFFINTAVIAERLHIDSLVVSDGIKYLHSSAFKYVAFNNPFNLVFPNSLQLIGYAAFSGANNIQSLTFDDNLKEIGAFSFDNDHVNNGVTIDTLKFPASLEILGQNVFNNRLIKHVDLSLTKITDIQAMTFSKHATEAVRIETLLLPATLIRIHDNAFLYNALTKLVLPNKLQNIGTQAFRFSKINSLSFADPLVNNDLTLISLNAFNTNQLQNATLDFSMSNLIAVGQGAFTDAGGQYGGQIGKVLTRKGASIALGYVCFGRHNEPTPSPQKTILFIYEAPGGSLGRYYTAQYGSIYTLEFSL